MIVAPRKQIAKNIEAYGYNSSNCVIVGQESGFINTELFDYWAESVLFPEIERKRILLNYKGDAILMLDGCTSHFSDFFQDECTYNGVYPFQDPPGTSDQVQALDLGIFSIQKTIKKNLRPPRSEKLYALWIHGSKLHYHETLFLLSIKQEYTLSTRMVR